MARHQHEATDFDCANVYDIDSRQCIAQIQADASIDTREMQFLQLGQRVEYVNVDFLQRQRN